METVILFCVLREYSKTFHKKKLTAKKNKRHASARSWLPKVFVKATTVATRFSLPLGEMPKGQRGQLLSLAAPLYNKPDGSGYTFCFIFK